MEIGWMDTLDVGVKVPFIQLPDLTTTDSIRTDNVENLTASVEQTNASLGCTQEELYSFIRTNNLNKVLFDVGREIRFPADSIGNGVEMILKMNPTGELHLRNDDARTEYLGNTQRTDNFPFNSSLATDYVVLYPSNTLRYTIGNTFLNYVRKVNGGAIWGSGGTSTTYRVTGEGGTSLMRPRITLIPSTIDDFLSLGPFDNHQSPAYPILVRDYTGNCAIVIVNLYVDYELENPLTLRLIWSPDMYTISPSGSVAYDVSYEFWQEQSTSDLAPIEGGQIVDITDRFSPRTAFSGLGIYPLDRVQMRDLAFDMWDTGLVERFNYNINGDPMDSIVAIRWYYGILGHISRLPESALLMIGNVAFSGGWSTGTVEIRTHPAASEYVTYSCGSILYPRHFNNFLDYSPFTELQIYIPYVGFVALNPAEFLDKLIRLDYNINLVTGATLVYVYRAELGGSWEIAMEIPCSMGMDVPLNVDAKESILNRMTTSDSMGTGAIGAFAMTGGAVGAIGAAGQTLNSLSQNSNSFGGVKRSGGINTETASLGHLHPFLMIARPVPVAPSNYEELIGTPDYRSGTLSDFTGYIKVGAIDHSSDVDIPQVAMDEIRSLLQGGVYIG